MSALGALVTIGDNRAVAALQRRFNWLEAICQPASPRECLVLLAGGSAVAAATWLGGLDARWQVTWIFLGYFVVHMPWAYVRFRRHRG